MCCSQVNVRVGYLPVDFITELAVVLVPWGQLDGLPKEIVEPGGGLGGQHWRNERLKVPSSLIHTHPAQANSVGMEAGAGGEGGGVE